MEKAEHLIKIKSHVNENPEGEEIDDLSQSQNLHHK